MDGSDRQLVGTPLCPRPPEVGHSNALLEPMLLLLEPLLLVGCPMSCDDQETRQVENMMGDIMRRASVEESGEVLEG